MSLQYIKISMIEESESALRQVNRTSGQYLELVDSIKKVGVLNAISVRNDPNHPDHFILIDGAHRFNAARDAGLSEIPAQIKTIDEMQILVAQLIANVHKVETKPVEYSKQLLRIMANDPLLTSMELATQLGKSPGWLNERLALVKLPEEVGKLVDEGKINLSNAYSLSKLAAIDKDEVKNYLDRAMTMQPTEFVPHVTNRIKELRDAKRAGRDPNAVTVFTPVAHLRKKSELEDAIINAQTLTSKLGVKDVSSFVLALQYALHLDPISAQAQVDKDNARKNELAAAKEKRKLDQEKKKAEEAAAATVA